jgi:hypothetical protein
MYEFLKPLIDPMLAGFREAAVQQTPVVVGLIAAAAVAAIGAIIKLLMRAGKVAKAYAEALLDRQAAEAEVMRIAAAAQIEKARLSAKAGVLIAEARSAEALPAKGLEKKMIADVEAARLFASDGVVGDAIKKLPELVQEAWAEEQVRKSLSPDAPTPLESPAAKRRGYA